MGEGKVSGVQYYKEDTVNEYRCYKSLFSLLLLMGKDVTLSILKGHLVACNDLLSVSYDILRIVNCTKFIISLHVII